MKIKVISRSEEKHTKATKTSVTPLQKNPDPSIHPHDKAREYVLALNATKTEKLFAKPFLAALSGHRDGVYALRRHPSEITRVLSGSGDGEVRLWHLPSQRSYWTCAGA